MDRRPAREFEVVLPVGHVDDDGRLHRTAALRRMTGHEEALLGDRKLRQNGGRLVTELLSSCVKRLGDLSPVTPQLAGQLTSADRNYLLLELRRLTFGNEIEANYTCPACGEITRLSQPLDELRVQRLDGDGHREITVELEDGYEDRDGEVYTRMVFRLPTGVDEERIAGIARDNPSRGLTALLTRCLVALGEMPKDRREAIGTKLLNDLTMADRARIEAVFRLEMPGVDMSTDVECDSCGRGFETTLDLTSFFSVRPRTPTSFAGRSSP